MFQKARQNRIFQDVVEQIQEAILQGTLNPGDKLPPERELKEMFGASRGTLREALRILEQKGLITIKIGVAGGAVVNALSTDQVSESLDLLIRYQKASLKDLAEFREGVEGLVAGLKAVISHDWKSCLQRRKPTWSKAYPAGMHLLQQIPGSISPLLRLPGTPSMNPCLRPFIRISTSILASSSPGKKSL